MLEWSKKPTPPFNASAVISSILKWISLLCFLGGILLFSPAHWLGFWWPKFLLLTLALLSFFVLCFYENRKLQLDKSIFLLAMLVFCFFIFGVVDSFAPWSSFLGISGAQTGGLHWALCAGAFLAAGFLTSHEERRIFLILSLAHALVSVYALLQFFGLDPLHSLWDSQALLGRSFSTFGNPNWLASFYLLTAPLAFALMDSLRVHSPRLFGALVFLDFLALLSTGSKAGFLGAFLLALVCIFFCLNSRGFKVHRLFFWSLFCLLIVLIPFTLWIFTPDMDLLIRSSSARLILWTSTFEFLIENPWGHGLDLFRFFSPQFVPPEFYPLESPFAAVDQPHSFPLQLWFEIGFLGMSLFYGVLFYVFFRAWPQVSLRPILLGILGHHITLLFGFETVSTAFIVCFFIGIVARHRFDSAFIFSRKLDASMCRIFQAIPIFSLLIISVFTVNHAQALQDFDHSREAILFADRAAFLEKAVQKYPFDRVMILEWIHVQVYSEFWDANSEAWVHALLQRLNDLSGGLDHEAVTLQAVFESRLGHVDRALELFDQSLRLRPYDFRSLWLAIEWSEEMPMPLVEVNDFQTKRCARIRQLLPKHWPDESHELVRIFNKNYPWFSSEWEARCARL